MFRKIGLTVALVLGVVATPLAAEEHYVLLMGTGYFPDYVYPEVGDTIKFVNASIYPMSATAVDLSWDTGVLLPQETVTIEVFDGMKQTFNNVVDTNYDGNGQPIGTNAIGVIEYTRQADLATNTLTGEVHEEAIN